MLRRLCLDFAGLRQIRDERDVDDQDVVLADLLAELAQGLQKRKALDVAHGAADLADRHVDVLRLHRADRVADFGGHVRDHLDGAAQEIAAAFFFDEDIVNPAGRVIRAARGGVPGEPFVVP